MKKIFFIAITLVSCTLLNAQNVVVGDVLRTSQNIYSGSARFTAMGGAMGALGGDLSAVTINPGGLGVYRSGEFSFTPVLRFSDYQTIYSHNKPYDYLQYELPEGQFSDFGYALKLNQIGFVSGFTRNKDEGWVSVNFSLAYNNLADFYQSGNAQFDDISYTYLDIAYDDVDFENNVDFSNKLYDVGVIYRGEDGLLNSTIPFGVPISQNITRNYKTSGRLGEYTMAVGGNYSHILYVGGSIGIQVMDYKMKHSYSEYDNYDFPFDELQYYEEFTLNGVGVNAKLGAIVRPLPWLRVGGAIHTPTLFSLSDNYYYDVSSYFDDNSGTTISDESTFDYNLITPYRLVGSLGFQFGKLGLLAVDYEYVDYMKAKVEFDHPSFEAYERDVNNFINADLRQAHNVRTGAEYRITKGVALRGGYSFYGSGFNTDVQKTDYHIVSGGLGFRSDNMYFDFTYSQLMTEYKVAFAQDLDVMDIQKDQGRIMATVGFRF